MNFTETDIPGVWMIEPNVFNDSRGYFFEAFRKAEFEKHIGRVDFIQDNESCSSMGALRGLHYQLDPFSQAKLVRVIRGAVLDVAVDMRKGSPTFGKHVAVELTGENKRQLFIPQGFAHGFHVLADDTVFTYKVDNPYTPSHERSVHFDAFGIDWKIASPEALVMSEKDKNAPALQKAEYNFEF
ncbi:MAG: dTDP-4-dehydrorhamnose 3,5-epimerase [Tannerellaceae bacterium]|jgi:dTDP-4-dehydrorhamnose 3,5-epimerase|nr:dTDP-4-dehydrorhamnose 3,5-epimerase [Tannerellaceae bacterium]